MLKDEGTGSVFGERCEIEVKSGGCVAGLNLQA